MLSCIHGCCTTDVGECECCLIFTTSLVPTRKATVNILLWFWWTLSVFLPRHLSNLFSHCTTQDIQHVLRQAWRAMHTARPKRQVHHRVPTRETMVKCIILIRFSKERTWIPPIICKTMHNERNSYMDTLIAQLPAARSCFRLERCCEFRALRAYQNNSEYDIEWCLFFATSMFSTH